MPSTATYKIFPLGDAALLVDFGNTMNEEINKKVLQIFKGLQELKLIYIKDVVPAYSSLAVYYDLNKVDKQKHFTFFEKVSTEIKSFIDNITVSKEETHRTVRIPVCYASSFSPDAAYIMQQNKISKEELIHLHVTKTYRVYMIGFLPGFAYMGEVNEKIAVPRKQEPRQNIAAGSVGIAGRQTGIYPFVSPGGWQIIGRTPIKLFDKEKNDPAFFKPGDAVKFYSITEDEFFNY